MLKSKIHNVVVHRSDPSCDGSIGISEELMIKADILAYEQVHVLDSNNGNRFVTYAIPISAPGIEVYGPASTQVKDNDKLVILAYRQVTENSDLLAPRFIDGKK